MAVLRCKMCGGTVEFEPGATVGVCDSCGTKQTLPRLGDERRANLYDRANHFRRSNEFDKAMGLYEQVLNEDNTDAEAHWSLVLCRYGIEYVEDPATRKRVPTVNRTQLTSIFDDPDYKAALAYGDDAQRDLYETEARTINEIQRGILAISQREAPFDVFICYKETDAGGRRTPDSVLANDLYHQLTQEGFKVFFARITLEDKLGQEYEPYIFAALNSAKVMVVLGTRPEYFNAVWVKNEWSRYLSLVKTSGGKKVLIPAYKDMDPYDLPEEFSHLQAQDMSKLGFMQDLIRGIKKIAAPEAPGPAPAPAAPASAASASIAPLLKRAFMFLEDGDFARADEFCEQILNQDPECAEAYLGKLMAELNVRQRGELKNCATPFDDSKNYQKAVRFGDAALKDELNGDIAYIRDRIEQARREELYCKALRQMADARGEYSFKDAADAFEALGGYKDAPEKTALCRQKAEEARKDGCYRYAKDFENGTVSGYERAAELYAQLPGWKDADARQLACRRKAEELRLAKAKKKAAAKRALKVAVPVVCICALLIALFASGVLSAPGKPAPTAEPTAAAEGTPQPTEEPRPTEAPATPLPTLEVGDTIDFGSYRGATKWLVLAVEDGRALLISEEILDIGPYSIKEVSTTSIKEVSTTWETSFQREWLNNGFIYDAFNEEEQALILTVTLSTPDNGEYGTSGGADTEDRIFLLSAEEAKHYLPMDADRKVLLSSYAAYNGEAYGQPNDGRYGWWLRSPGASQTRAALVMNGEINGEGESVVKFNVGIRPALWIDAEAYAHWAAEKAAEESVLRTYPGTLEVGDTIQFGDYEGETEWLVLAKEDGRALITSKYALPLYSFSFYPYGGFMERYYYTMSGGEPSKRIDENKTWEISKERQFLNRFFIEAAFSEEERKVIVPITVSTPDSPYGPVGGSDTFDHVFLLSADEAKEYFSTTADRRLRYSERRSNYAKTFGWFCQWVLRSPGSRPKFAVVSENGDINLDIAVVGASNGVLRPAMWIRLDA